MRSLFALVLGAAALYFATIDWQSTIGAGNAYRLTSIGASLERALPGRDWIGQMAETQVGGMLLALPLALVLAAIGWGLWITRPRRR